jgi:acyl-ACP thioesterase
MLLIISLILLVPHFYRSYQQQEKGRAWCDYLIADYEKDGSSFINRHAKDKMKYENTLKPGKDFKGAQGWFKVETDNNYICRYWQDSLRGYQIFTYDGKEKRWIESAGFDRFEGID